MDPAGRQPFVLWSADLILVKLNKQRKTASYKLKVDVQVPGLDSRVLHLGIPSTTDGDRGGGPFPCHYPKTIQRISCRQSIYVVCTILSNPETNEKYERDCR